MLVTFKSKNSSNVMMFAEHAKPILDMLGKELQRGVITAAEAGAAVATLEAEIAGIHSRAAAEPMQHDVQAHQGDLGDGIESMPVVSFATRAFPLLEMLRNAQQSGHDIIWGV